MDIYDFSDITETLKQFNATFEISGLSEIQDSLKRLKESINCNCQPLIELSEKWNEAQENLLGGLKPAFDNISELSQKISESLQGLPEITIPDYSDLFNAFEKYENAAPPCLYTASNVFIPERDNSPEEFSITKEDVQDLRMEVKQLKDLIVTTERGKCLAQNEFSDEAEYIFRLICKHYEEGSISSHSVKIYIDEFSADMNDSAFKLGLEELQVQRYISDYKSFTDGSYHIELCLRCTNALKEGKTKLSSVNKANEINIPNPPYIQALIDNGVIIKNMNVVKSLNEVGAFVHDHFADITITKQLLKQFHHNGKEYSNKKLEEAVTYAYSIDR